MTKYSKKALDAAEDAVIEAGCHHLTDRAIVTAVFDTLERAPWWEEVEVGYEFRQGEPHHVESPTGIASERPTTYAFTISTAHQATYFRDTRWQPPVKPLKVGDLIETEEQAASLLIGTIAVSPGNTAFRKVGINEWRRVTNSPTVPLSDFEIAGKGDRIIYLPSGDSEPEATE